MSVHGIRHRGFNVTGRVGHKRSFVAKPHLIFQGLQWTRLCCRYLTLPRCSMWTMAPVSGTLSDSQIILLPHLRVVPLYINVAHSKSQLGSGLSAVSLFAWLPVNSSPSAADRRLSCWIIPTWPRSPTPPLLACRLTGSRQRSERCVLILSASRK